MVEEVSPEEIAAPLERDVKELMRRRREAAPLRIEQPTPLHRRCSRPRTYRGNRCNLAHLGDQSVLHHLFARAISTALFKELALITTYPPMASLARVYMRRRHAVRSRFRL